MTIKIIKQSEANMWYNAHVGEQFEVDERKTTDQYYVVKETFLRWVRHVYKGDCEILHEPKSNNDVQPQLNKPDVLCCKAFIEQLSSKLTEAADLEENDFKRNVINSKIGDLYTAMKVINEHSAL